MEFRVLNPVHLAEPERVDDTMLSKYHDVLIERNGGSSSDIKRKEVAGLKRDGMIGERAIYAGTIDGRPGFMRLESYVAGRNIYTLAWTTSDEALLKREVVDRFFGSLVVP